MGEKWGFKCGWGLIACLTFTFMNIRHWPIGIFCSQYIFLISSFLVFTKFGERYLARHRRDKIDLRNVSLTLSFTLSVWQMPNCRPGSLILVPPSLFVFPSPSLRRVLLPFLAAGRNKTAASVTHNRLCWHYVKPITKSLPLRWGNGSYFAKEEALLQLVHIPNATDWGC